MWPPRRIAFLVADVWIDTLIPRVVLERSVIFRPVVAAVIFLPLMEPKW